MAIYQKKPVRIEALRLTKENIPELLAWANSIQPEDKQVYEALAYGESIGLNIPTKEGAMLCSYGDYLIKEPYPTDDRMFYPCKPDMFNLTYDLVSK